MNYIEILDIKPSKSSENTFIISYDDEFLSKPSPWELENKFKFLARISMESKEYYDLLHLMENIRQASKKHYGNDDPDFDEDTWPELTDRIVISKDEINQMIPLLMKAMIGLIDHLFEFVIEAMTHDEYFDLVMQEKKEKAEKDKEIQAEPEQKPEQEPKQVPVQDPLFDDELF